MTSYTQYQLSNPPTQALDILIKLGKTYSFRYEFNQTYRTITLITNDTNLITLIDSKAIPNIVKSTITIPEYDDTKSIMDIESLVLSNGDLSNIRPESLSGYKSILVNLQNQAKNLNISNYGTMTISQLQTAISQVLPKTSIPLG